MGSTAMCRLRFSVVLALFLGVPSTYAQGTITTVAGNGIRGFSGDGGPATSASLFNPDGVAVDAAGNFYIADTYNHRIRQVSANGTITTIAGDGSAGFSGDGSPATSFSLYYPVRVAVDAAGNLYIADTYNHRIRRVSTGGTITTVAGNGSAGSSGDGGPATSARLQYPTGVAVDTAGNLYIAGNQDHRVRKVDTSGMITTVAGTIGSAGFSGDGGPATSATLRNPYDVALDAAGNLFIADLENDRIRRVDTSGIITTAAGNGSAGFSGDGGPATSASLYSPTGVEVDVAGNLYVADADNFRVRKVTPGGIISTVAGNGTAGFSGDGGPATSAAVNPYHVAVDATGSLYIADSGSDRVRKVGPSVITVTVDIKPGSFPNSINLGSGGTIPVAILSSATFDATDVAPSTVTLASAPVRLAGKGNLMSALQDVDNDGFLDLVVHVQTAALELSETDVAATLSGTTFDGVSITGTDSVRVVP